MVARWATFATGLWLLFAPLVLGYEEAGAVLHDIAVGLVVCVGAIAALDWPVARFAQLLPAAWLVGAPRALELDAGAAANHLVAGALLAVLVAFPGGRVRRRAEAGAGSRP
jgi:hypothetical protein